MITLYFRKILYIELNTVPDIIPMIKQIDGSHRDDIPDTTTTPESKAFNIDIDL